MSDALPRTCKRITIKRTILLLGLFIGLFFERPAVVLGQGDSRDPVPLMAYYYIWYSPASWDRAKTDYPILGRYSSDDRAVMEQHVRWAQEAGIDGFIVSWKATPQLNRRLQLLIDVATEADFALWIIYQGLDFDRNPLTIDQIDHDLAFFVSNYAHNPVFHMYNQPVVIWSGTWEFTAAEISTISSGYRRELLILASERNVEDYQRLAHAVDGNAYYWSSVDPFNTPNYETKLIEMGEAVHQRDGLWVAPAAPGFDARLVGGTRVISRNGGDTFRQELNAAVRSSPDAIGIISWNEFSENSHIEPSVNYGTEALNMLIGGELNLATPIMDFDSSAPGTTDFNDSYNIIVFTGVFLFMGVMIAATIVRRAKHSAVSEG